MEFKCVWSFCASLNHTSINYFIRLKIWVNFNVLTLWNRWKKQPADSIGKVTLSGISKRAMIPGWNDSIIALCWIPAGKKWTITIKCILEKNFITLNIHILLTVRSELWHQTEADFVFIFNHSWNMTSLPHLKHERNININKELLNNFSHSRMAF